MKKESEVEVTRTEIKTFKARIKASKPHFVQKVIAHKTKVEDALEPHFCTYITVFEPKLKPRQQTPVIMCHISNGAGQCLFRCKTPIELANVLRNIADIVTSNEWLEKWQELESYSDKLITGEILLDEDFIDVGDFKKLIKKESSLPALESE